MPAASSPDDPAVTVVIPTRAIPERSSLLRRAIASAQGQQGVRVKVIVVVNGDRHAPELMEWLRAEAGVELIACAHADLPNAHRVGREAVATPWFAALDDDDALLPGALAHRLRVLEAHPDADVVVTNGLLREGDRETLHIPPELDVAGDPLDALRVRNWLLPGSWLARTDRVPPSLFAGMPRYRECTWLALRFATQHAMRWDPVPTVVYTVGSPGSQSNTRDYLLGGTEALRAILSLTLPRATRRFLERELELAHHDAADFLLRSGEIDEAWRQHARSLRPLAGLRWLPFTRHLVHASVRRALARPGWIPE